MKTVVFNSCTDNLEEQKYLYASVPSEYHDIITKLLYDMAGYGKNIIDDCNYICSTNGRIVFECWNSFQIALEAIKIGRQEDADIIIDNIVDKLKICNKPNIDKDIEIYITKRYIAVYHKILKYISDLDSNTFNHCDDVCQCDNKFLIKILNIFYSALANYNIGNYKTGEFFINYIDLELKRIYNEIGKEQYSGIIRVKIDENHHLLSYVTYGDIEESIFDVNVSTGKLVRHKRSTLNYAIKNDKYLIAFPQKGYVCNILNVTLDDEEVITAQVSYRENPEFNINTDTGELVYNTYSDIINGDYKLVDGNLILGYGEEI